ncbi:hypothetical protein ACFYOY_46395 [Streptomyces sp. NPDC007875]|uniref:hypothetical protein n=1 Tax=Streptomyces sp. NPDC007875 TaxID=3364783 RepID=UPI00369590BC
MLTVFCTCATPPPSSFDAWAAVLRPHSTKAVDAALLLAEMAVPHPARPAWPKTLHLSRAEVPFERMLSLDERLEGAAARPVVVPETIVSSTAARSTSRRASSPPARRSG